jgi:hypothetical protein
MNRRVFLSAVKGSVVVGGGASTAGCSAITGSNKDEEPDPTEESFQYFFVDETGTLGGVVDGNEPPEDAADWRVITNTHTEEDWRKKQANDVQAARDFLSGELDRLPQHQGHEGTVDQIVQKTREVYQAPEETLDPGNPSDQRLLERLQQDEDPERFTRALIHATDAVTDISSSGGKDNVVPSVAEYAMGELGLEFPEYSLSTVLSTEPAHGNRDDIREESIRERGDGSLVGTTGMVHTLSLLTFKMGGDLQVRYVENTDPVSPVVFEQAIRKPEESEYRRPINEGTFEVKGQEAWPEHYATGFEQEKIKRMQEMGVLKEPLSDTLALTLEPIDDALNDRKILPNFGYEVRVSEQITRNIEDFVLNPSTTVKQRLTYLRRALYLIMQKQIAENDMSQPVYGAEDKVRIKGTMQSPEFYHELGTK